VPDFAAVVDHSDLADIVINLEFLDHFYLQVEIVEFTVWFNCAFRSHVGKLSDKATAQNFLICKKLSGPVANLRNYCFFNKSIHVKVFPRKGQRNQRVNFVFFRLSVFYQRWWKQHPRTVEKHINCELLMVLVGSHSCPVDPNDLANALADWQVLKVLRKKDH